MVIKSCLALSLLLLSAQNWDVGAIPQDQSPTMVLPKVEHKIEKQELTTESVTRTCPDGYEGHFVGQQTGFGAEYWFSGTGFYNSINGYPGYTICFKKEFMDQVRKNPDLLTNRPQPPRPS